MGLRSASVRRPDAAAVMAPALTETAEPRDFELKRRRQRLDSPRFSLDELAASGKNGSVSPSDAEPLPSGPRPLMNGRPRDKSVESLPPAPDEKPDREERAPDVPVGPSTTPAPAAGESRTMARGEEVDQLFKNLGVEIADDMGGGGDLGQNVDDLLGVLNSMEGGMSGGTAAGDVFPGALTSLFGDDVMMNMCVDENLVNMNKESLIKEKLDEALKKQFQLKRKCDFLLRRLRKLQSRSLGKHVCDEVTGILEYTNNLFEARRGRTDASPSSDPHPPLKSATLSSLSLLMRQMEHSSSQQANYLAKNSSKQKYFGAGPSDSSSSNGMKMPGTVVPSFSQEAKAEVERVTGELGSQLYLLQTEVDSDLTASSSGCDSCDDSAPHSNLYQHTAPISKRAIWRWSVERALLASRWTWLQGKMADLEYKIRQTNEMRRQLRQAKGVIRLAAKQNHHLTAPAPTPNNNNNQSHQPPNGLLGEDGGGGCARTAGVASGWKKRRLVKVDGLHLVSKRCLRQATIKCWCRAPGDRPPCMLCTGRPDPTPPSHTMDMLPLNQRLACLDPAYHPQLSFPSDVSQSLHYSALMKHTEWQGKAGKAGSGGVSSGRVGGGRVGRSSGEGCIIGASAAREAVNAVALRPSSTSAPSPSHDPPEPKRCKVLTPASSPSPGPSPSLSDLPTITASLPTIGIRKKNPRGRRRKNESLKLKSIKKPPPLGEVECNSTSRAGGSSSSSVAGSVLGSGSSTALVPVHHLSPLELMDCPTPPPPLSTLFNGNDPSKRKRENSYDIDNIVIPYCMAASTRPEKLHYKEILTPKWRLIKEDNCTSTTTATATSATATTTNTTTTATSDSTTDLKNGVRRPSHDFELVGEEDASDECAIARHERCEVEERKKFLSYLKVGRSRGGRRVDSRAESSGPSTPDQALSPVEPDPPPSPSPSPCCPPTADSLPSSLLQGPLTRKRTISLGSQPKSPTMMLFTEQNVVPYEPRLFPLSDEVYQAMVLEQKNFQEYPVDEALVYKNCESSELCTTGGNMTVARSPSTDSIDSAPTAEDPNDPEWTSTKHKT